MPKKQENTGLYCSLNCGPAPEFKKNHSSDFREGSANGMEEIKKIVGLFIQLNFYNGVITDM